MDESVRPRSTLDSSYGNWSQLFRSNLRDKSTGIGFRMRKSHQRTESKKTLEVYYNERKMDSRLTVQSP